MLLQPNLSATSEPRTLAGGDPALSKVFCQGLEGRQVSLMEPSSLRPVVGDLASQGRV